MYLKGAVSKHGGRTTPFMSMKGVTHVIAENLSAVKTDKAMKVHLSCRLKPLSRIPPKHSCTDPAFSVLAFFTVAVYHNCEVLCAC